MTTKPRTRSHLARSAYNHAMARLRAAHPVEFARLLGDEREALGLPREPRRRGSEPQERAPLSPLLNAIRTRTVTGPLGIAAATWLRWVKHGVPVDRKQDVADVIGVPVTLLWPEPEPQQKPAKKAGTLLAFKCDCGKRFATRGDLARHRLNEGHSTDEAAS